jgi:hypothetical protein
MITVYDLESFDAIGLEDSPSSEPIRYPEPTVELRLQEVASLAPEQVRRTRDFSAVIAGQLLAQLQR